MQDPWVPSCKIATDSSILCYPDDLHMVAGVIKWKVSCQATRACRAGETQRTTLVLNWLRYTGKKKNKKKSTNIRGAHNKRPRTEFCHLQSILYAKWMRQNRGVKQKTRCAHSIFLQLQSQSNTNKDSIVCWPQNVDVHLHRYTQMYWHQNWVTVHCFSWNAASNKQH